MSVDAAAAKDAAHYAALLNYWAEDAGDDAPQRAADCKTISAMISGHVEAYAALIERNKALVCDLENARGTIKTMQEIIANLVN